MVRRGRNIALLACAAGALAAACQVIAGIDDHKFRGPDAITDSGQPDAIVIQQGKVCGETPVPGPPGNDSPSSDAGDLRLVFAFNSVDLPDINHPYGYDLDGVCTCQTGEPSSHSGQSSCALPSDSDLDGGCDFDAGVDNSFARLISSIEPLFPTKGPKELENKNIICGSVNVILVIDQYNGGPDDTQIVLSALRTPGIFHPPDADGGVPHDIDASACGLNGYGPPYPNDEPFPGHTDGKDNWSLESLDLGNYNSKIAAGIPNHIGGYVTNGLLVVNAIGSAFSLPLSYEGQTFAVSTPILTAKLAFGDDKNWHLTDGIIAGRSNASDLVTAIANSDKPGVCDPGPLGTLAKGLICQVRDISANGLTDFSPDGLHPCDGISMGLAFTAISAGIDPIAHDVDAAACDDTITCDP